MKLKKFQLNEFADCHRVTWWTILTDETLKIMHQLCELSECSESPWNFWQWNKCGNLFRSFRGLHHMADISPAWKKLWDTYTVCYDMLTLWSTQYQRQVNDHAIQFTCWPEISINMSRSDWLLVPRLFDGASINLGEKFSILYSFIGVISWRMSQII